MDYVATRPVYLPASDLLELELHLMETQPGKNGVPTHGVHWRNVSYAFSIRQQACERA